MSHDPVDSVICEIGGDPDRNQRHLALEAIHRCSYVHTARFERGHDNQPNWRLFVDFEKQLDHARAMTVIAQIAQLTKYMFQAPLF